MIISLSPNGYFTFQVEIDVPVTPVFYEECVGSQVNNHLQQTSVPTN